VTREELYDLVWSTRMSRLAPEFGISDVALAKVCVNPRGNMTGCSTPSAPGRSDQGA
jgi:hypothetical protein